MAKETCHNCVYAWRDLSRTLADFASGFPTRPTCANQPGHYGQPTPTPLGKVCPSYRLRPPAPTGEDVQRIILTNGMVAYVDAADYEELSQYTWCLASGGYAARSENRKWIFMHRQIMNPPEGMFVDHIKGNRLDNTRASLRICTLSENARNRAKRANATSRYRGVSYSKNREKWVVALPQEANQKFVGAYDDELEAARAYDHAAVLYLGDSAPLNFPEEWPPARRAEVRAALVGANHPSPSSRTQDRAARPAGGVEQESRKSPRKPHDAGPKTKADGRARRATGHEPRVTKRSSHAETPGRRDAKREAKKPLRKPRKTPRRKRT